VTNKVLGFSAATEAATGVVAVIAPSFLAQMLLGAELPGVGPLVVRCFGIALVSLAIACWPGRADADPSMQPLRAMVVYNAMIAGCLGYAGTALQLGGPLLWPAVAIHAVVALLLLLPRSTQPSTP
jgi:hypothetical protein